MMKFYSLAVCGILCALSSMSYAKKEREELDREMKSLRCPPGKRPVKLIQLDPNGAKNPREKRDTNVWCVKNDQEIFEQEEKERPTLRPNAVEVLNSEVPNTKCPFGSATVIVWSSCLRGTTNSRDCKATVRCLSLRGQWTDNNPKVWGPMPPPITVKELDDGIKPKECPFAHRPVNISPFCSPNAEITPDCPPPSMACVPEPFGNNPGSLRLLGQEWGMRQSPRTEAELNFEMAHKACIFGQRPARVSPWCRRGANDVIDCGHAEVWCIQESFTPALKTVAKLERETLRMICPRNHYPTLIKTLCPAGSKRTTDCEAFRKACRPKPEVELRIGSRNSFARFDHWDEMQDSEHWSGPGRSGHRGRPWRTVNKNNHGF